MARVPKNRVDEIVEKINSIVEPPLINLLIKLNNKDIILKPISTNRACIVLNLKKCFSWEFLTTNIYNKKKTTKPGIPVAKGTRGEIILIKNIKNGNC
jgi:hypothetical protein